MLTIETGATELQLPDDGIVVDDAQLAAVAFLARYSGRTLDAYRHDLRGFFQWAADNKIAVLAATRPHIELFRGWMEERGLAASTIDRRLSTVCGFYRFAHIDGRIASNPAQCVRRPQVHPSNSRGLDRSELGVFLFTSEQYDRDHAALAVLLGVNGLRALTPAPRPSTTGDDRTSIAASFRRTIGALGGLRRTGTSGRCPQVDLARGRQWPSAGGLGLAGEANCWRRRWLSTASGSVDTSRSAEAA